MLETVEHVSTEADVVVLVLLVGDVLDEHRGIEVDQRARQALTTILREVDGCEGTIRTVALTDHRRTTPATTVGIEIIGFLACSLVLHFDEVGGVHRVPLSIDEPREDRAFVAPLAQVLHGSRPHTDIGAAVG